MRPPASLRVVVWIGSACTLLAACSKRREEGERVRAVASPEVSIVTIDEALLRRGRVQVAAARREVPKPILEVAGEVQSAEGEAALVSSLVAGRIAGIEGNVGDRVRAGQSLVTLQAPDVAKLRADARRAEARFELAAKALARLEELEAEGATSQASVEHAHAESVSARAELDAVRTQLAGLGFKVAPGEDVSGHLVVLRSPIDGAVAERRAILGASVSPGDALFRIVASSARLVLVRVPESRAASVVLGTKVRVRPREVTAGEGESSCGGVVERATGVVDENRTVGVRVRLEEPCALRVSGRSLTVELPLSGDTTTSEAVVLVPKAAVIDLRGKSVVFVQEDDRPRFSWRAVRTGPNVGSSIVVEDGLREGERVVVRGTVLLKGEVVRAEPLE